MQNTKTAFRPFLLGFFLLVGLAPPATAQTRRAGEEEEPTYEDVNLLTRDRVQLRCTYYPGSNGKQTVPVILLHGWGGRRGEYHQLALGLQRLKHAVIVPDLRGHGRSLTRRHPNPDEDDIELKREDMNRRDIESMGWDVEAVKQFLMEKNNKAELNIELLCVVGSDLGALLALNWAAADWSAPRLPTYKQGQDVKALVLVSPKLSFKGLTTRAALSHRAVCRELSLMIISGSESDSYSDAKRIHRSLEKYHADPKEGDLVFIRPDTSLEGTRMLAARGLSAARDVAIFINERLVKRSDRYPWTDRTSPLSR